MSTASRLSILFPLPKGKALGVLLTAILLLLISIVLIELPVLRHTHGNVLFPLDNAYVNITVARNLAFYQVWGVSKYAFQSAATSLLYPITLAPVFFIFGAHLVIPLVINFLLGAYFLLMLQRTLIRYGLKPSRQLLVLLGAMALTLLPLLVASGMEYTLQLLCVFLFLDALAQDCPLRKIYLLGLLAVAARYEDLIVIALACLFLGRCKGWKAAATLAAFAVSPVLVFGIISLIKKSYFIPNPMLLGPYPATALILAIITIAVAAWSLTRYSRPVQVLLLLVLPFTVRNLSGLAHFQRACVHIYDQQYLTAGFVRLYYYKSTVGVNEPGAVSYFSEGRKLDYTGLVSLDVTQKRTEHVWSPLWADSLSKLDGIRLAIVATPWFDAEQLPQWIRIASWDIPDGDTARKILFYAINDYDTTRLRKNLHSYQPFLPANVSVRYY
jgi:hypothetical protein